MPDGSHAHSALNGEQRPEHSKGYDTEARTKRLYDLAHEMMHELTVEIGEIEMGKPGTPGMLDAMHEISGRLVGAIKMYGEANFTRTSSL